MIYLDNAATTLKKPPEVQEAVAFAMSSLGNAGRGVHEASLGASRTVFDTRLKLAELFNAKDVNQIAFTCNATESLNIALKGLLNPKDHVITTELEHNSALRPLYELESSGVELTFLKSDEKGRIRYDDFKKNIRGNTKMIVCTHGSNLTGNLIDIEAIGSVAKSAGLLFVVDASQTAGVFPIDVQAMNIDVLCFTGHKSLFGPQGTGGMCVRKGLKIRPLKSGGSGVQTYNKAHPREMPTALEAGTLNSHGIAGLGAGVDFIRKTGIDEIRKREQELMRRFYHEAVKIPGVKIYGDFTQENRCPIVSLNIGGRDSSEVSDELFCSFNICTRPGAHCAPLMHKALGTVKQGAVRFSFSYYNTEAEVDAAAAALKTTASE